MFSLHIDTIAMIIGVDILSGVVYIRAVILQEPFTPAPPRRDVRIVVPVSLEERDLVHRLAHRELVTTAELVRRLVSAHMAATEAETDQALAA